MSDKPVKMLQVEIPETGVRALVGLLEFGQPVDGPLKDVHDRLQAALSPPEYALPFLVPEFPTDRTRTPVEPDEAVRRMRAALPKRAWVWRRWWASDSEEQVVIRDGWFGNRCVIRRFAWYNCYRPGAFFEESAFAFGNWFSYGSLPGINQEGPDWPERMAQAAWKHLRRED